MDFLDQKKILAGNTCYKYWINCEFCLLYYCGELKGLVDYLLKLYDFCIPSELRSHKLLSIIFGKGGVYFPVSLFYFVHNFLILSWADSMLDKLNQGITR